MDLIPATARREHPTWHVKQILSTYVLDEVLRPRLPADACVYIALTTSDLWPGEGWNFVFGQASLSEVWASGRSPATAIRTATTRLPAVPAPHAEDRLARDGAHVLDATLHLVRVQHVRQQPSGGSGPPPLVALPSLLGEALLRHRSRPVNDSRTLWPSAGARGSRRSRSSTRNRLRSWKRRSSARHGIEYS